MENILWYNLVPGSVWHMVTDVRTSKTVCGEDLVPGRVYSIRETLGDMAHRPCDLCTADHTREEDRKVPVEV